MIAGPIVTCAASRVKSLHTGNLSCSWPDLSRACAIASIGNKQKFAYSFTVPLLSVMCHRRHSGTHRRLQFFIHVSRVVYVFGSHVKEPPTDITPTFLTTGVLSTLRQADFVAHSILRESGKCVCWSDFRHLNKALCTEALQIFGRIYIWQICVSSLSKSKKDATTVLTIQFLRPIHSFFFCKLSYLTRTVYFAYLQPHSV